jgi:hypothetical protein
MASLCWSTRILEFLAASLICLNPWNLYRVLRLSAVWFMRTRSWIPEIVHAFFDPQTAEQILSIQIGRHGGDFVQWAHTKNGLYTVRSAYNLACTESFFVVRSRQGGDMSSGLVNEEKQWKTIWKINAHWKMKIHLWRSAHDCLPSGVQMRRRQIPTSDTCVFCEWEEDIENSVLLCQFAQEVWRTVKASFNIQLQRRQFISWKQWLFNFLANANEVEATTLAVGCWHIWEAQNDARNNQVIPNPSHTSARITAYVNLLIQHCFKTKSGYRLGTNQATPLQEWGKVPTACTYWTDRMGT